MKLCDRPGQQDKVLTQVKHSINNTFCRSAKKTLRQLLFKINQQVIVVNNLLWKLKSQLLVDRDLDAVRETIASSVKNIQSENELYCNRSAILRFSILLAIMW